MIISINNNNNFLYANNTIPYPVRYHSSTPNNYPVRL